MYIISTAFTIITVGNILIDSLMKQWFGQEFDKDGQKAAEGKVCEQLLERLLEDQYIKSPPPKSTGREVRCWAG